MADTDGVNWLLLAELVVVLIGVPAFLFYWNRLVGSVAAFLIRLYIWRYNHAYISIESLQISPLAGRVAFRDVEYHSSNLSVRALHGHVTWRYWKLRVRNEEDSKSENVKRNRLPCRITIYAEGVELFVFNRTPAYDAIVERMKKHEREAGEDSQKSATSLNSRPTVTTDSTGYGARLRKNAKKLAGSRSSGDTDDSPSSEEDISRRDEPPKAVLPEGVNWFRETLPLELRIESGSMVLGSDATPTVLVADFKRAEGVLSVSDSKSACDLYKTTMDLKFEEPKVLMRTNVDYSGPILAHGKKVYDELLKQDPTTAQKPPSTISSLTGFHALARRFPFLFNPKFSSPPVVGLPADRTWKGLARYRYTDEHASKSVHRENREYAKVTTLLDTPALDLTYYSDTPGLVPLLMDAHRVDESDKFGNVEPPPEYGIDIVIHGGNVTYGPWADRQRDALQKAFAPSIFFNSEPRARLEPGELRIHTALVLNLSLSEETTLRMPTREASKDWMHDNAHVEVERRYGWLDVLVGPNSSVLYTQSQHATERGYEANLVLHLDSLQIASSVNLETFIKSKFCKLAITMPTPLQWNAQRDWDFDLTLDTPDIVLLRDHVTLISDLSRDWSSGVLGDFHHFVPNHYNFRIALVNYAFHLNINDHNIVDRPRSREDNALLDLYGPKMTAYVAVATTRYRPEFSILPFNVAAEDIRFELGLPRWDTHRTFDSTEPIEVGRIGSLGAQGSYRYYSSPKPDQQECLTLHLDGKRVAFKALGWALRRLFCVKDNYFGSFTQFTTMQEYLERFDHDPQSVGDPVEEKYRPGRSDPFVVNVTMNIEESLMLLSDEIYGCKKGIAMPVPQLQMNLKSTEAFMELSLDATPTYVIQADDLEDVYARGSAPSLHSRDAIFVEGIELKANRLFGPQPQATTYLCLWELTLPRITAFLSPDLVATVRSAVSAVAYNFTDSENAPASIFIPKSPPDVTLFKVGIDALAATYFAGDSAVSLDLPAGLNLDTSSLATQSSSSAIGLIIPTVNISLLQKDRRSTGTWKTVGSLSTDISMDMYNAPKGWEEKASRQQAFLREMDESSARIWYMYKEEPGPTSRQQYSNGVYLPDPRIFTSDLSDEDDSESMADSSDEEIAAASSVSSSDFSKGDPDGLRRPSHGRTRSQVSGHRTKWPRRESSDSFASDTSRASIDKALFGDFVQERHPDMSNCLFDEPPLIRPQLSQWIPDTDPGGPQADAKDSDERPYTTSKITYGKIIRFISRSFNMDINQSAVGCAMSFIAEVTASFGSEEQQLDRLLSKQVDSVLDEIVSDSKLFDIRLPCIDIRLTTDHAESAKACEVIIALRDLSGSITTAASSVEVVLGVRFIDGTVLAEVDPANVALRRAEVGTEKPGRLLPVALLHLRLAKVRYADEKDDKHIRVQTDNIDAQMATIALAVTKHIIEAFTPPPTTSSPRPSSVNVAMLLYQIIQAAEANNAGNTLPAFAYESAYGLHVDDQRNIRRDPGWTMLSNMRQWFRSLAISPITEAISSQDIATTVIHRLARFDDSIGADIALVQYQSFVQAVFAKELEMLPKGNKAERKPQSVTTFIQLTTVRLEHSDRLVETRDIATNSVVIKGVSVGLERCQSTRKERPFDDIRAVVGARSVAVDITSSIIPLAQAVMSMRKPVSPTRKDVEPGPVAGHEARVILDTQIEQISLSVVAGGLRLNPSIRYTQISLATAQSADTLGDRGSSVSRRTVMASVDGIEIALLQLVEATAASALPNERVILSIQLNGVKGFVQAIPSLQQCSPNSWRVSLGLDELSVDSRPQLRTLWLFTKDWVARYWPQYRPVIESLRAVPTINPTTSSTADPQKANTIQSTSIDLRLETLVQAVHLQVRAAKSVWLRWDIGKIYATHQDVAKCRTFGLRIEPQIVGAYGSGRRTKVQGSSSISLPTLTVSGNHRHVDGRSLISADINLGFFTGILKPAVLDRLLSLHQRLGADIAESVKEYKSRVKRHLQRSASTISTDTVRTDIPKHKFLLNVKFNVAGVRFGLRADDVATTLLFEALSLQGHATNVDTQDAALLWQAKADHFGMSLGHIGTTAITDDLESMRRHRSAYMVLDVDAREVPATDTSPSRLNVTLKDVHMVMHIAALSELTDLIKSWQSDIHVLNDSRATEVAEVKSTTSRLLKKLDTSEKAIQPENSWFASRVFAVEVTGLGIAVPLDETAAIDLQHRHHSASPAMLFSIRMISFHNRKNETARFRVHQMAIQFSDSFDQGIPEHFAGDSHSSINRMSLTSMDCEAQMSSSPDTWMLSAHGQASDFRLSLAPDIVEGVFKLLYLYEQGKQRVSDLERHYWTEHDKREAVVADAQEDVAVTPITPRKEQRIIVRMSYTFNSGVVELHRMGGTRLQGTPSFRNRRGAWHDTVILPAISVWLDYTGPRTSPTMYDSIALEAEDSGDGQTGMLMINTAIHESRNVLRPSILPFIVELVNRIERKAKGPNTRSNHVIPAAPDTPGPRSLTLPSSQPGQQLTKLRVTLRIDRSEFRLSCNPDSDAYVDVKWESGGFLASTTLGGQDITTLAGTVSGVTATLSHEFAEQGRNCIEAGAKDLAFSLALCPGYEGDENRRGLSVVLDTQIAAVFRLEAFSAWLIFTSVWIDDAPALDLPQNTATAEAIAASTTAAPTDRKKMAVAALVQIRSIDFDAHIAVSKARLSISPVVLRTLSNGERTEVDLRIGATQVVASGDISGEIRSDSIKFNTVRRSSRATHSGDPTVLSMAITAGDLSGLLFVGDINVVRFHLEPALVTLKDDWHVPADQSTAEVTLAFIIQAGKFHGVLRLLVIPRLVGNLYSIFDMVDSQTRIAIQRSETFKKNEAKRDNDPSPLATVIISKAKIPGVTNVNAPPASDIKTAQTMRFDLGGLDIGIFNENKEGKQDAEFSRFVIGQVQATLYRDHTAEGFPKRDLGLNVASIRWDTTDGALVSGKEEKTSTAKDMIERSAVNRLNVLYVPSARMDMPSIQVTPLRLDYDVTLNWAREPGDMSVFPHFIETAILGFSKVKRVLGEQKDARSRRLGLVTDVTKKNEAEAVVDPGMGKPQKIVYHRTSDKRIALPNLKPLGEGGTEAAWLFSRFNAAMLRVGPLTHDAITLSFEEGMDILLKLYEKQLPDRQAET